MILFFRLPSGLTMEREIYSEEIEDLMNHAHDLLCTRYDMSKINYYITLNDCILNQRCNLKSYDTLKIHITKLDLEL
jgi:hypothetical protein